MSGWLRAPALLLAIGVAALSAKSATAESLRAAARVPVGPPNALFAMPGVDSLRSRRTAARLSATPRVASRLRVAFGIGRGLVVREDGTFVVLHPSARVSRFDPLGKLTHSVKLAAEPSSAAVITSAGLVAFVVQGELVFMDGAGRLRFRTPLSAEATLTIRSILATRDGGVLLASNRAAYKVSGLGELEWRTLTPEPLLEVLEALANLIAVGDSGAIFSVGPAGKLTRLGELGAAAGSVVLRPGGRSLLSRAGPHRLASFDLGERRIRTLAEDPTLELDGPLLFTAEAQAVAFTTDGMLVRFRADGSEAQRVPVDTGSRKAPSSDFALLLGDGRLVLARAAADAVLVSPSGEVSTLASSGCPDPVGVYPASANAVMIACRSGNVLRLE